MAEEVEDEDAAGVARRRAVVLIERREVRADMLLEVGVKGEWTVEISSLCGLG